MKIALLSFYSGHVERGLENWALLLKNTLGPSYPITIFQNGPVDPLLAGHVTMGLSVDFQTPDSRWKISRVFFLDYWSRLIFRFTRQVIPFLEKGDFDIIIPTNGGWQSLLIRLYTWLRGKKMVVVGQSGKGWDDRVNLWCCPDVFVGLSQFALSWAGRVNPFIKIVHISNGVDLNRFSPRGKAATESLPRPQILVAGALERNKQIDLTMKAVAQTPYSLLVLGNGPDRIQLEKLGKQLMDNRFAIKTVPFEKIPEYYRGADVFTLGSWKNNEAFGLVYCEAMACNVPVVATDDAVRREIVGSAGVLVDPADTMAYSRALTQAVETKWGNRPRQQAEKFSWESVGQKYETLFDSLCQPLT